MLADVLQDVVRSPWMLGTAAPTGTHEQPRGRRDQMDAL